MPYNIKTKHWVWVGWASCPANEKEGLFLMGRDALPTLGGRVCQNKKSVAHLIQKPRLRVGCASCPANKTVKKLKHINLEGHAYFISTNIHKRQKIFLNSKIADIVLSAIFFLRTKGYFRLYSFVIMPEHLHLIIFPQNERTVSQIMHSLKSYTAKKINSLLGRHGKIWQDGFYERIIRKEDDLREKASYIENNPLRKKLVEEPDKYLYSSACHRDKMDYF